MKLLTMFLNLLSAGSDTYPAETIVDKVGDVAEKGMQWHPEKALEVLPKAGIGMLVIFVIITVIILATLAINKIFSKKK